MPKHAPALIWPRRRLRYELQRGGVLKQYVFDNVTDPNDPKTVLSETQSICDLPLNASNPDVRVNFLQHHEYDPKTGDVTKRFSWVTDCELGRSKLLHFQRGARSRWKIENETLNRLKNQGYNFEHNYGHGQENLSTVLMLLMFLAFLVDQIQQACCPLFGAVFEKLASRRALWNHLRRHVRHFEFRSFDSLWSAMLTDSAISVSRPIMGLNGGLVRIGVHLR